MTQQHDREGFVQVPGGRVWYRIAGADSPSVPLLVLHGGPGAGHDYLEPLAALARERPVVLYDQLGCGKSDIPHDHSLWRIERFAEEVEAVRRGLRLDRVHLLGQSWGGFLAIEYTLGRPTGVQSLVLASTSASMRQFTQEASRLVDELPQDARETIRRCEAEGATASPEYQAACQVFYQRHLCRLDPWPEPLLRSVTNLEQSPVYAVMNGPSEFTVTGNLRDWDRTARLGEIAAPTLITVGRFDELPIVCAQTLHAGISSSTLRLFENSSHMAHLEEPELFAQTLSDFLRGAEAAA